MAYSWLYSLRFRACSPLYRKCKLPSRTRYLVEAQKCDPKARSRHDICPHCGHLYAGYFHCFRWRLALVYVRCRLVSGYCGYEHQIFQAQCAAFHLCRVVYSDGLARCSSSLFFDSKYVHGRTLASCFRWLILHSGCDLLCVRKILDSKKIFLDA